MSNKEITYIVIFSLIKTTLFIVLGFIFYKLLIFNYDLAIQFCRTIGIPSDLCLSVSSLGFANNITVILTLIGISFFIPLLKFIDYIDKKAHCYVCIY